MHVAIDDSWHQKLTLEVDDGGRRADKCRHSLVVSDVDDASVADGQRLGGRVLAIGSENYPVAVDAIGWCFTPAQLP